MIKISKKSYSSVMEMVRDTIDDKKFVADFEKHLGETQIAKQLFVLRNWRGLSEQDVAKKMGCSQSRVSKLEHGKDVDVRLGDLIAYIGALGLDATILVRSNAPTGVDPTQVQASCITRLCDDLAKLAVADKGTTPSLTHGIGGDEPRRVGAGGRNGAPDQEREPDSQHPADVGAKDRKAKRRRR